MEQSVNVTELDDAGDGRGDSTSVMLAAESLAESACPQPRYQQLVEAEVVEAMPGMFMIDEPRGGRGDVQEQRACSRRRASSSSATCGRSSR